jgi:hypothetical protein
MLDLIVAWVANVSRSMYDWGREEMVIVGYPDNELQRLLLRWDDDGVEGPASPGMVSASESS